MTRAFVLSLIFAVRVFADDGSIVADEMIAAGHRIVGVCPGSRADRSDWRIDFAAGTTAAQRTAARNALLAIPQRRIAAVRVAEEWDRLQAERVGVAAWQADSQLVAEWDRGARLAAIDARLAQIKALVTAP